MGTAGPLALAKELLDDGSGQPFFVLNRCAHIHVTPAVIALIDGKQNMGWRAHFMLHQTVCPASLVLVCSVALLCRCACVSFPCCSLPRKSSTSTVSLQTVPLTHSCVQHPSSAAASPLQ
jgi:hypothetical protein